MTTRLELMQKAKAKRELAIRQELFPISFFKPLEHQNPFHKSKKKNKAIFGGNRSGKTINGAAYVVEKCCTVKNFKARASTWADLSVPIQQTKIYNLLPKDGSVEFSWSDKDGFYRKFIRFKNTGAILRFKTYEQGWKTYQGFDADLEWNDEEAPESIIKEQRARLIDRNGELIRTMTPLDGITYTYDEVVINQNKDEEVEYWYWRSDLNEYINQTALQRVIGSYAEKEAEVRSTGHFLNLTSGNAYYSFGEHNIVSDFDFERMECIDGEFRYMKNRPLEISCDFNVDLMSWGIGQEYQMKDYQFDYIELERHANTELMCQTLKNKYANHNGGFIFYGDIAGNQRHPEASRTNWAIIKDEFPNAELCYQSIGNIKDRVDATNARFKNGRGEILAFVTRNCKRHIKDFRRVTWEYLINKNHKDVKNELLTHASDGESYKFMWKYDLRGKLRVYNY